jgi:hypothetical protein
MADAEIANEFRGIGVKLRCPRCRAMLDISRIDARKRFICGGCRLNTDVTDCATATEGMLLSPGVRLGMSLIPAAFAGFFFMFVESLAATGFSYWGESALVGLAGGGVCGLAAAGAGGLAISRDAPRAASRITLAALTLSLGAFLRWRLGDGSVSDTMLVVLELMALFWLCVGIFNIFRVFRPPPAMQVAHVVEVDNLSA